jgi:hypothetical protein
MAEAISKELWLLRAARVCSEAAANSLAKTESR